MATDSSPGTPRAGIPGEVPHAPVRAPDPGMYEQIVEVAVDAIVTINDAHEIVHFNRGAERIFGYDRSEMIGRNMNILLPEQLREPHAQYVAAFGESADTARLMGHRREVFGRRKDGTSFPAEASIMKHETPDGDRLYTALMRDVTERKRMNQQQAFLAEVSAALSGSLDYDATLESVVRLPVPALGDACVLELTDEAGRTKRVTFEHPALASSPRRGNALAEAMPLVARGQPIGTLTLLRLGNPIAFDASDRMVAENFAARAALAIDNARLYHDARRATRARDAVLAVVSHDLRSPLSAIAMCSQVLTENPPSNADARHDLAKTIHDSTKWMANMIRDLLDVSAIDAGVLSIMRSRTVIAEIATTSMDLLARAAMDQGVDLVLDIEPELPPIEADPERLVQAISNLVGNAVKFTPAGGHIGIAARTVDDSVEIEVRDTGCGISEDDLEHVFDRYWHGRGATGGGTGLGLAIAKGIIEAHGGSIRAVSTLGAGSTFTITLPLADT